MPSNLPFTKVPPIEEATCDHGTAELVSGHDRPLAVGLPVVSSSGIDDLIEQQSKTVPPERSTDNFLF